MFQNFYDSIIVLTQEARKDRQKEFKRHGDMFDLAWDWFYAVESDSPRDSFNRSHHQILQNFMQSDKQRLLVVEDDCRFKALAKFNDIHLELEKENFRWVYYGANVRPYPEHIEPKYVSKHLRLLKSAYTTHCIGYTKDVVSMILDFYNPNKGQMYDAWLDECFLKTIPAHITVPFLAVQAPVFSDLWNRNVDYSDTFRASEEHLKSIEW
jgi:hypothetical protein